MAIAESQVTLPPPPTGVTGTVDALHVYNPESGHYEPIFRGPPLNANLLAPVAPAVAIIAVVANAPVWIYHMVFANTGGAVVTVTLAEPGGNTYIVQVPANDTLVIQGNALSDPLFMSTAAGNITVVGTAATVQVTLSYVVK